MKIAPALLTLLNPNEFWVLCYLSDRSKNTICHTTTDKLSEESRIEKQEISRVLNKLIHLELISYGGIEGSDMKIKVFTAKIKPDDVKEKPFIPPTLKEVEDYCLLIRKRDGYDLPAKRIYNYYNDSKWKDGRGNDVKNWKTKILNNWCKDEYKITSSMKDNTHKQF